MVEAVWRVAEQIDGWLSYKEAALLDKYNTGVWCEIGSWKGKSTIVLAAKSKGFAIDWFRGSSEHPKDTDTLKEFLQNTKPWRSNITLIKKRYQTACSDVPEVDLLFLDAEHTYEATKEVFSLYAGKVKKGGHIIFHDVWNMDGTSDNTPWPGVTKFCLELLDNPNYECVDQANRSSVFKKL